MAFEIELPSITVAALSPATVAVGGTVSIVVSAELITKLLYPDYYYSGEIQAGEAT